MEEPANANTQVLCRVCLTAEPPNQTDEIFLSIFEKVDNIIIADAISELATINCLKYDGYTKKVCKKCAQDVVQALETKQRCIKSDVALREALMHQQVQPYYLNGIKIELVKCEPDVDVTTVPIKDARPITVASDDSSSRPQAADNSNDSSSEDSDFDISLSDITISDMSADESPTALAKSSSMTKFLQNLTKTASSSLWAARFEKTQASQVLQDKDAIISAVDFPELKIQDKKNGTSLHYCCACKETFKFGDELMNHFIKCHLNCIDDSIELQSNKHQCKLCRKLFNKKLPVTRHMRRQHTNEQRRERERKKAYFKCSLCSREYSTEYLKAKCEQRHNGIVERIPCPREGCGRSFKTNGNLIGHLKLHDFPDLYPFTCEICGKNSRRLVTHNIHAKSHSNIRNYECYLCGIKLKHKKSVEIHMRKHTGFRPYQCEICPNNYMHHTDLKRHVMIHTGVRPYKCLFPGCEKGFIKRSSLQAHEKSHNMLQ